MDPKAKEEGEENDQGVSNSEAEAIETIIVPEGREAFWIRKAVLFNIAMIGSQSKRIGKVPPDTEENRRRFNQARLYLDWMYHNLQISPSLVKNAPIRKVLEMIIKEPQMHFPDDIVEKATALYNKWEDENWGADDVIEMDEGESATDEATSAQNATNGSPQEFYTQQISLPAPGDPIFGTEGIMHGVLMARSANKGMKVYILNPEVPKISARVFGHNGLQVGTWFPLQIVALARGAHGSKMGGIYGSVSEGTYSIVASHTYHDLDRDEGDILYYSGSNSHSNTDPLHFAPSSAGTKSLKVSLATGKPIRVLRSGGAVSVKTLNKYAPTCGIRYDGLYRVVQKLTPKNARGGMYEQFKLVRLPGQPQLDEIRKSIPTWQQIAALEKLQGRGG